MSKTATTELRPNVDQEPKPAVRTLLTRDGADRLAAELARLRHQLDVEFAARLSETRAFGELHNNDDYLQSKEEGAVVEARIRQLEAVLGSAEIVDDPKHAGDAATVGSRVEVEDLATGVVRRHELAGGFESYGPGRISANAPVGQALIGRRPGDEVTVELPTGRSLILRVLTVDGFGLAAGR